MEDPVTFEFQVFVKETYYYGPLDCPSSLTVGVRLLDFNPVIIQTHNSTKRISHHDVDQSKGKSCKFVMTTSTLIQLLQTSPNSIEVCLMKSHDISHDSSVLAIGKVNDSKTWCKQLTSYKNNERLIINKSYLVHVCDTEKESSVSIGHVIIKVKLYCRHRHDTKEHLASNCSADISHPDDRIVSETGQTEAISETGQTEAISETVQVTEAMTYLPNTWIPPPLYYTATRNINEPEEREEEEEEERKEEVKVNIKTELLTESNWTALMKGNINSWPWSGYSQPMHLSVDPTCTCTTKQVDPISCPLLAALCNEIQSLQLITNNKRLQEVTSGNITTEDKGVQTDDLKKDKRKRNYYQKKKRTDQVLKRNRKTKAKESSSSLSEAHLKQSNEIKNDVSSSSSLILSSSQLSSSQLSPSQLLSSTKLAPSQLLSPSQLSPSHLAPSQLLPSHLAPSQLSPSHLVPSHEKTTSYSGSTSSSLLSSHKTPPLSPTPIIIEPPSSFSSSSSSSSLSNKGQTEKGSLVNNIPEGKSLLSSIGQRIYLVSSLQSITTQDGEQKEEQKEPNETMMEESHESLHEPDPSYNHEEENINVRLTNDDSMSEIVEELYSSDFESDHDESC